ncbi:hypothetical protein [Brucella sp. NBRC 12950]|uniref:hypothetical protein n=1 Tax=Brucella sp. NBRC 12950 TaxID=2994518 RepID=UPI002555ED6B|nr:hypothetical protein [Brucella sp. NBRC 12950]
MLKDEFDTSISSAPTANSSLDCQSRMLAALFSDSGTILLSESVERLVMVANLRSKVVSIAASDLIADVGRQYSNLQSSHLCNNLGDVTTHQKALAAIGLMLAPKENASPQSYPAFVFNQQIQQTFRREVSNI